ncbi:hypothetical protein GQ53DRAFT_636840, partial [Thozetella sp. PMI_491]
MCNPPDTTTLCTPGLDETTSPDLPADSILWDGAYDLLRKEAPELLARYEARLSSRSPDTGGKLLEDTDPHVQNQLPQNDPVARRAMLQKITALGLHHMEDKKVSGTIWGHEIALQDGVAAVAKAMERAEEYIKDAVKDLPYASVVIAGVSLVLPLLTNPVTVEAAHRDGFTYVTFQMRYYAAIESLLLPKDVKPDLRAELTRLLTSLYKLVIEFQIQSVLRFYRSRTNNYLRGIVKYDGWDEKLQAFKQNEAQLVEKLNTSLSASHLDRLN